MTDGEPDAFKPVNDLNVQCMGTVLPEAQISVGTDWPRNLYLMNNDRLVNELGL